MKELAKITNGTEHPAPVRLRFWLTTLFDAKRHEAGDEGVRAEQFAFTEPSVAAQAVFDATARFHDPAYAPEWQKPTIDGEFAAVADLVLRGLSA
ncbi:hypothetical protein [Streptomyces sp. V1I1]|uniref:hypothetical protein n=1 Tax=Streptomyces sp. V1I1 TaxID=3042272 RepID=UPI002784CD3E|nr:hypothetical protein [Streptomyces sp. V1I1]MDQ0943676.1 hypothetical protein [Streptomyces sp. V1I1]